MTSRVIVNHGFDATGRERRECHENGIVECPKCGASVPMTSETEVWTQGEDGRWRHSEYGMPTGEHCGLMILGGFEGFSVVDMEAAHESA